MDAKQLTDSLIKYDNGRARSLQTAIGVSSLGGCRRQVWHKIQGDIETNPTLRLAAIMGNAIHSHIEKVLPTDDVLIEHRVEIDGLPPATIDYFNTATGEVVDWKTITLKGRDYFVTKQKRWQVQTYAFILTQAGHTVNTVTLVGIPRDGFENDIIVHSEPYDEAVAVEALKWLDDLRAETDPPTPERDAVSFCKKYCGFYGDKCNGIPKDISGEAITDETATVAAKRYVEILAAEKKLAAEKDATKQALEGVAGITIDGIKVSWSQVDGRQTPDMDALSKLVTSVPMKQGAPSIRLNVK